MRVHRHITSGSACSPPFKGMCWRLCGSVTLSHDAPPHWTRRRRQRSLPDDAGWGKPPPLQRVLTSAPAIVDGGGTRGIQCFGAIDHGEERGESDRACPMLTIQCPRPVWVAVLITGALIACSEDQAPNVGSSGS